jgi:hypothetical protein
MQNVYRSALHVAIRTVAFVPIRFIISLDIRCSTRPQEQYSDKIINSVTLVVLYRVNRPLSDLIGVECWVGKASSSGV